MADWLAAAAATHFTLSGTYDLTVLYNVQGKSGERSGELRLDYTIGTNTYHWGGLRRAIFNVTSSRAPRQQRQQVRGHLEKSCCQVGVDKRARDHKILRQVCVLLVELPADQSI